MAVRRSTARDRVHPLPRPGYVTVTDGPLDNMHEECCWLSVLVPAYNADLYVGECLDSILEQRTSGVEVVIVDDGSTDTTAAVIADRQRRQPNRIRLRRENQNKGIASTRNLLVREARGKYLWFIDADDTMLPGAIEALRVTVDRHAPDLILCDYRRTNGRRERRGATFAGPRRTLLNETSTILAGLFKAGQLHPWSKISRRSLWTDALRFPDGMVFEDVAVMPKLASRVATAYYVPDPWVSYRQWGGSIVATMNPRKCLDLTLASLDFSMDLRRPGLVLTDRAWFAARHFAARHFMRAMIHLRGSEEPSHAQAIRQQCLSLFVDALDGQIPWLQRQYLRRGWLLRLARLRYWMREASQDATMRRGAAGASAA